MAKAKSFRVGRVTAYLRGSVWYLRYHENGRRRQVRASDDKTAARQLAAQTNAQLEIGAPAPLSFEPIDIVELRQRWLDHHEHVRRSSPATINRYRTATEHLLRFVDKVEPVKRASNFHVTHAEAFVRHLRQLEVAPNGRAAAKRRPLRDKGVRFILEVCRNLFNFAAKRRHLPTYTENPFTTIEIDKIPVEDGKPIIILSVEQETAFLEACDDWQSPLFLTLMLTGLGPGELVHLMCDDVDYDGCWLHIRNKADLGWKIKTRNERRIPLLAEHVAMLRELIGSRSTGPLFLRQRFAGGRTTALLDGMTRDELRAELKQRLGIMQQQDNEALTRQKHQQACNRLWVDMGMIKTEKLRLEFIGLTDHIGLPKVTAPKTLRHGFATSVLHVGNVDPLIRNQLMGHVPAGASKGNGALGMTAVYTHVQLQTVRRQLVQAIPAHLLVAARCWLAARSTNATSKRHVA